MNISTTERYARAIEGSKRVRFDIERDVIRGRTFDFTRKFLPDGISKLDRLGFLNAEDRRLLGQIQGRTYANMFGLVERFIAAKVLDVSKEHWFGDQVALESLVRFTDEEIKHQMMFRRIEALISEGMPAGYRFAPDPNAVAQLVLSKSTWAVLALTCHIELFVLAHYRESIDPDGELSELFKDVFLFHWKEESQHAIIDELEWKREDAKLTAAQRDAAVDDLIALVGAVDGMLQAQAKDDVDYFMKVCRGPYSAAQQQKIRDCVLAAYRWQYIVSGVEEPRFQKILGGMITEAQMQKIGAALAPILH
jgi:hypothetical protein